MGTNYYVQTPPCPNACEHCADQEQLHLGKSSGGWRFLFRADPDWPRQQAFTRWLARAATGRIEDEYGAEHTLGELLRKIHAKDGERSHFETDGSWGPDGRFMSHGHDFADYEFS